MKQRLTPKEEELLQVLWRLQKAFVKEIVAELPKPRPHYNTVSTIVRKMVDKGFVGYESFGNTHRYYPLVSKKTYTENFMQKALRNYFDNSYKNMVSFFAKEQKISADELREIIDLIENQNQEK